jgi:hypothetical protein
MNYAHSPYNTIVRTLEGSGKGIDFMYQVSHVTSCGNLQELIDHKKVLSEKEAQPLFQ